MKVVAKAFQDPSVDLEDLEAKSDFWAEGQGQIIQERIFELLRLPFIIHAGMPGSINVELLQACCSTLNSGLAETSGPFKLPAMKIASFISECNDPESLCTALPTAIALVSAHTTSSSHSIDIEIGNIFGLVAKILLQFLPSQEPDFYREALNFFSAMCPKHMHVLFGTTSPTLHDEGPIPIPIIITIGPHLLSGFSGNDTRTKMASTTLFTDILQKPKVATPVPHRDSFLHETLPALTGWLVWNFAGGAARSHLNFLNPLLRQLVFSYGGQVKVWMEKAFTSELFWPKDAKATMDQRRLFAARAVALRGKREETRELVKEFWLQSMGTEYRYA
jgi:hypothetical protein